MNVINFEVMDNDIVMRTQSGMIKTTPPMGQIDGCVEFHNVQWDFSYTHLLDFTGYRFQGMNKASILSSPAL